MKPIIEVENLSKKYTIGAKEAYGSLRDEIMQAITAPFKRSKPSPPSEDNTIWALKDVSFKVNEGEIVGIIGRNGAGKSTLLKVLSRIAEPTSGKVTMRGRVASLLEVGTGFHPELTGRENIFLNGALLGMTNAEIKSKFDEIVAFSEIEKFLDTPVKRYSSGMYVRLAFAVAAHMEPEILIVDEVLAVGDAQFQKKCLGKMGDVTKQGRTILFVSHNMLAIQELCNKVIWLDKGQIIESGASKPVIASYLNIHSQKNLLQKWEDAASAPGNDAARLIYASVETEVGHDLQHLTVESPIIIRFRIRNQRVDIPLSINYQLYTQEGICVLNTSSERRVCSSGVVEGLCKIPANFLNSNFYYITVMIHYTKNIRGFKVDNILAFEVHDTSRGELAWYGNWVGVVRPKLDWELRELTEA